MNGMVVGVAGATGAVGRKMTAVLEERNFPVSRLRLFASERSVGKKLDFKGRPVEVELLSEKAFTPELKIVLFSAGGDVSRKYAPAAAKTGAYVIDNSSAWRMEPQVPLVIPEVNPDALRPEARIIANPNCSTIQMVCALAPLHRQAGIKRIITATYQAVSGAGQKAVRELEEQLKATAAGEEPVPSAMTHRIAHNLIPQIDLFEQNGYTREELKMVNETRKILEDPDIRVSATCVRVPVFTGHSEAVTVEFKEKITAREAREILKNTPGIRVLDEPENSVYPLPSDVAGKDEVFVGRIREDSALENGLSLWVVADNLRKGAALNAVQIAELLVAKGFVS